MTTPAGAIKNEVRGLIDNLIETLRQPAPITSSQLHEYHLRSEKLVALCHELDRIGTRSVSGERVIGFVEIEHVSRVFQPSTNGIDVFDGVLGNLRTRIALPAPLSFNYDALVDDGRGTSLLP